MRTRVVLVAASIAASACTNFIFLGDFLARSWLSSIATLLVAGALMMENAEYKKRGAHRRALLGMPLSLCGIYLFVIASAIFLEMPLWPLSPEIYTSLQAGGFTLLYGWGAGLIDWQALSRPQPYGQEPAE